MGHFNTSLFFAINGLAGKSSLLDAIGKFFALGAPFIFAGIFIVVFLFAPRHAERIRRAIIYSVLSGVLALIFNYIISHVYFVKRPFVVYPHSVHQLISHAADASFPSDHVAGSVAFATGIAFAGGKWSLFFGLIALFVAFARVFTGVHWPLDVIGGAVVGFIAGRIILSMRGLFEGLVRLILRMGGFGAYRRQRGH